MDTWCFKRKRLRLSFYVTLNVCVCETYLQKSGNISKALCGLVGQDLCHRKKNPRRRWLNYRYAELLNTHHFLSERSFWKLNVGSNWKINKLRSYSSINASLNNLANFKYVHFFLSVKRYKFSWKIKMSMFKPYANSFSLSRAIVY